MGNEASARAESARRFKEKQPDIPPRVKKYEFPFENLAFGGGGSRTISYLGALKVMDEIGLLKKIKRYAGTSGGALIAMMLAIGCDTDEMYDIYTVDFKALVSDHTCGGCSLLPNLVRNFGWNPGDRVLNYIQSVLIKKCFRPDLTFGGLYKEKGVELCIVACNVSTQTTTYFHPKTTPTMCIAVAARMSLSLPLVFQPVIIETSDEINYYVDGGITCNYPLFAYDGWYLSMKPEDAFLNKLGNQEDPFAEFNSKTLGFISYPTGTFCSSYTDLQKRYDGAKLKRPNTSLAKKRAHECDKVLGQVGHRQLMAKAAKTFWAALHDSDTNGDSLISADEFKLALTKVDMEYLDILFGRSFDADKAFKELDLDGNGQLTHDELVRFMDSHNFPFRAAIEESYWPTSVRGFLDFTSAILNSIDATLVERKFKPEDANRTIGIHTDYIDATDFKLETKDREFLIERAEIATVAFLEEFIQKQSH